MLATRSAVLVAKLGRILKAMRVPRMNLHSRFNSVTTIVARNNPHARLGLLSLIQMVKYTITLISMIATLLHFCLIEPICSLDHGAAE